MCKREYINAACIKMEVDFDGHLFHVRISFRRNDGSREYSIDIWSDGVEVVVE